MNKRLFLRHILLLAVLCALILLGCPLYRFAGFTCPCCGVTRAWLCFLTGDFRRAFAYNAFFLLIPGVVLLFAHRNLIPSHWRKPVDIGLLVIGAAMFVYNLLRWHGVVIMP